MTIFFLLYILKWLRYLSFFFIFFKRIPRNQMPFLFEITPFFRFICFRLKWFLLVNSFMCILSYVYVMAHTHIHVVDSCSSSQTHTHIFDHFKCLLLSFFLFLFDRADEYSSHSPNSISFPFFSHLCSLTDAFYLSNFAKNKTEMKNGEDFELTKSHTLSNFGQL